MKNNHPISSFFDDKLVEQTGYLWQAQLCICLPDSFFFNLLIHSTAVSQPGSIS